MADKQECSNAIPITEYYKKPNYKRTVSDDCRLMMLASLRAMTEELEWKLIPLHGSFLEWYRSCDLGIFDHDLDIGLFVEQFNAIQCPECIRQLTRRISYNLQRANRSDLAEMFEQVSEGHWWQAEYIAAQSKVMPAKVYLRLLPKYDKAHPGRGYQSCDLDLHVLHHNGTHMARYLPRWGRVWISYLRPLHPIDWVGVDAYAPFPVKDAIEEEFGAGWAVPVEYGTWHNKDTSNSARRTPFTEMIDTVFTDCGHRELNKNTRKMVTKVDKEHKILNALDALRAANISINSSVIQAIQKQYR
eukprot:gnl/MRDRNA2_/MRDRNA2_154816_c0_seq1.p1 gnl/MRDRNA2_/MRDRNA2_154816_c0~~gnl/MRDRNA2_/MRDRNA2_154816_c0_seq1.p1  ORF type:complete len:328 (-),score=26.05 gnl/MRDRNA2_/MRDRNA2_154816_c0_seq1:207-1112(-)